MDINVKRIYRRLVVLSLISLVGIFLPSIIGLDGFEGGFAMSTISLILFLSLGISAIIVRKASKQAEALVAGKDVLVHWTYTKEEWTRYAEAEHILDKSDKKITFIIISAFALFFGILFLIFDHEAGLVVFLVMLGLIVLIAPIAYLSARSSYKRNKERVGVAYIGRNGVLLNGQYSSWTTFGAKFEGVKLHDSIDPKYIELNYSVRAKNGRTQETVRVPVPSFEKDIGEIIIMLNKLV